MSNESDNDVLDRKRAEHELKKQFAAEARTEFEHNLQEAKQKAVQLPADNEVLQSIIHWIAVLKPLGAHETFIVQAWTGWQYRQSHLPMP